MDDKSLEDVGYFADPLQEVNVLPQKPVEASHGHGGHDSLDLHLDLPLFLDPLHVVHDVSAQRVPVLVVTVELSSNVVRVSDVRAQSLGSSLFPGQSVSSCSSLVADVLTAIAAVESLTRVSAVANHVDEIALAAAEVDSKEAI